MLRKFLLASTATICFFVSQAQDTASEKPKPVITGSVDAYYRYNFHNAKDLLDLDGNPTFYNNYTSFTNSHNSFELGMASVKVEHSFGKVGGVIDLGFGKRAEEFSYNDEGTLAAIKQAYLTYAPSDKVTFTMGKWATHVGYELLDPQLNRNYSMSYMFSYGPFFHTGLKADISINDNIGFMVGVANPTDMVSASFDKKFILAQFHAASSSGNVSGYLNYVGGKDMFDVSSHQIDLTATGKISDQFSIGYNGTVKFVKDGSFDESWWGSALYLNIDPTPKFGLTVRGEYFDDKDFATGVFGTSFFDATLSLNIKPADNFMIIPEFRLDAAKDPFFYKNNGDLVKSTGSFILACVFSF
jgi:hypothetical protein